ncbi:MerR family transcriptional regulator [Alicycliphilus denitrificans]|uniref:MerR family transcriptional regulator n=1 Tax=Alicycliphilus denitrificans TaxID=179636 RepID=UPI00384D6D04
MSTVLPPIPAKRYFTIGEVAQLCGVKPHVLRYWEQEFSQLRPVKRRGNRRYYQHHEVLMIRRIRDLLYDQGFTIVGARNRLQELAHANKGVVDAVVHLSDGQDEPQSWDALDARPLESAATIAMPLDAALLRKELQEIRALLL